MAESNRIFKCRKKYKLVVSPVKQACVVIIILNDMKDWSSIQTIASAVRYNLCINPKCHLLFLSCLWF